MAILNFPPTAGEPTDGSFTYEDNGVLYSWDGYKWTANSESGFDNVYVEVAGDNMTGDLTLGTDKITLNATDGSAEFAGTVTSGDVVDSSSTWTGIGVTIYDAGVIYAGRSGSGNLWAGRQSGTAINTSAISADGSATFAGSIVNQTYTQTPYGVLGGPEVSSSGALSIRNSSNTETGLFNTTALLLGGTLPSAPNITLLADGSATFAGQIDAVRGIFTDAPGNLALRTVDSSTNKQNFGASSSGVLIGDDISTNAGNKISLNADGSAEFAGNITILSGTTIVSGATLNSLVWAGYELGGASPTSAIRSDGSATFDGNITAGNVSFNLEADDDTKYTATTNEDGEQTLVYNGAVLDVKERLTKTDAALQSLKAALVSTTDHASLKEALITALADI